MDFKLYTSSKVGLSFMKFKLEFGSIDTYDSYESFILYLYSLRAILPLLDIVSVVLHLALKTD